MKNIKLLLFAFLIIGFSTNTFAGDKFGIRAGWQYNNMYSGLNSYGNGLSSFYLGVFKEKAVIPLLKVGIGLDYNQAGTKWNDNNSLKIHQLNIPVYAKLKLGSFSVLLGAAPTIKVFESWTVEEDANYKSNLDPNAFDLPVFAGLGFNISALRIEARYYVGTKEASSNITTADYKNQYLQLGLALSI